MILARNMFDVKVHFSQSLSVIFIRVDPTVSRKVCEELGLTQNDPGPYWDTLSKEESQRRLILLPWLLLDTEKEAIKRVFSHCGIYKEISLAEAKDILANAAWKNLPLNRTGTIDNPLVVE